MIRNILFASRNSYRILMTTLVAVGSILIFNAEKCNAEPLSCGLCLRACGGSTIGINPGCSECMQTCIDSSGCTQDDVNSFEKYCKSI